MEIPSLFVLLMLCLGLTRGQTEVETTYGPVVGTEDTYSGETVRRFRGIPFAKPPTGKRRFLPPEEPDKWTEPLDTKEYSPQCYQTKVFFTPENMTSMFDEDCLYLNVFAPKGGSDLPVMVWIHGGGLLRGSASDYYPESLASTGNVIVVSINYRLDIFGFFSTGNDVVEGNAALLDQVMALKWVKNNIKNFGGDTEKVTIFGESAGAMSVSLHMVSPMSKGLFQRAISQSGTFYETSMPRKSALYTSANLLATFLKCPETTDSQEVVKCLQTRPAKMLLGAVYSPEYRKMSPQGMSIVTGDGFLPDNPKQLWDNGELNAADYIIGVNSDEGTFSFSRLNATLVDGYLQNGISTESQDFKILAMLALASVDRTATPSPTDPIWRLLSNQYLLDYTDPIQNMRGVMNMNSDLTMIGPSITCARATAKKSGKNVYFYYFDQVLETSQPLDPRHISEELAFSGSSELNIRAGHGVEMAYVFGYVSGKATDMPSNIYAISSEADRDIGQSLLNAWVTFAKTGNPKILIDGGTKEVDWPKYNATTQAYVEFKDPMSEGSFKTRLLPDRVAIYSDVLPKYQQKPEDDGEIEDESECEDTPSTIDRDKAETALFILVAVVIVLLLMTMILLMSYCSLKKELKNKEEAGGKYAPNA